MKVGDLVTLSAAGSKLDQNHIAKLAKFGIVMKLHGHHYRQVFKIDWILPEEVKVFGRRTPLGKVFFQSHLRYEIKKLKKNT